MNFSYLILTLLVIKSKCQKKSSTTGGLKWVTFNQWHEMPGGVAENPSVRLSDYGGDICSIDHDGCWQGGTLLFGNLDVRNSYDGTQSYDGTVQSITRKRYLSISGHYILQTDPINEKPSWNAKKGGIGIWATGNNGRWAIGSIYRRQDLQDPFLPGFSPRPSQDFSAILGVDAAFGLPATSYLGLGSGLSSPLDQVLDNTAFISEDAVESPHQARTWKDTNNGDDWIIDVVETDPCLVAPLDYDCDGISSGFGRNKSVRILVNPGRSVKWKLVDWDWEKSKGPLPKSAVYIDKQEHCKNVVTAYTDCSDCQPNKLTPSQRAKDGYVYYYDLGWSSPTRYDSNEYKVLIEEGIKKYELISLELEESSALEEVKTISKTSDQLNPGRNPAEYVEILSLEVTESSSWSHSINWEVGASAELGSPALGFKWTFHGKVGGNEVWGTKETFSRTATSTARGQVPPHHGVKITMTGQKTQKEVPFKAQVKITYDDDTTRTVTDSGTWKNVVVTEFKTTHGEPYPLLDF